MALSCLANETWSMVVSDPAAWSAFWWNWAVDAAVAIATFGAVLVALFGQGFRAKFVPPRLALTLLNPDGEMTRCRLQWQAENGEITGRTEDCRYYHLRVSNARRWSPASQVQVQLLQMEEPAANGELQIAWT